MRIVKSLKEFGNSQKPVILTIGNFDGVHLGHQYLFKNLCEKAHALNCVSAALTFFNAPITVLDPKKPVELLCTASHKQALIESLGVDCLLLLEFSSEFAKQEPEEFLDRILQYIPLSHIVLGYDSRLGKGRKGDPGRVKKYAAHHGLVVDYLNPLLIEGSAVSSSKIRHLVNNRNFDEAERLLGRRYSHLLSPKKGRGVGKTIGYSTLNFDVHQLCLPPLGVYSVWVKEGAKKYPAIANLGFAPTVRDDILPQLEVHILEEAYHHGSQELEIIYHQWIRDEKKFDNLDHLRRQIGKDIDIAKEQLHHQ